MKHQSTIHEVLQTALDLQPRPEHRTPLSYCPECGVETDRATSTDPDNAAPEPGDISVCAYCGAASTYDSGLGLVTLGTEELAERDPDLLDSIHRAQKIIRDLRSVFGPHMPGVKTP